MAKQAQLEAVRPVLNALDAEATAAEHVIDAVEKNADKAAEVIEHGLEKAADVVPEVVEKGVHAAAAVSRRGARGIRDPKVALLIVSLSGAAAGVALGVVAYRIQKKRIEEKLSKEFDERFNKEMEEMRQFYIRRAKAGEFVTPRTAAEALLAKEAVDALEEYRAEKSDDATPEKEEKPAAGNLVAPKDEPAGKNEAVRYDKVILDTDAAEEIREQVVTVAADVVEATNEVGEPKAEVRNVFVNGAALVDDEWDMDAEEAKRNPAYPYVISHDEYMENAFEHPQHSLTYYAGDDVLVDERDEMINDVERLVGTANLGQFGHGSRDANIVYVRNENPGVEADFEIALSQGKFSEEVMGLRHSDESSSPRFRRSPKWGDGE